MSIQKAKHNTMSDGIERNGVRRVPRARKRLFVVPLAKHEQASMCRQASVLTNRSVSNQKSTEKQRCTEGAESADAANARHNSASIGATTNPSGNKSSRHTKCDGPTRRTFVLQDDTKHYIRATETTTTNESEQSDELAGMNAKQLSSLSTLFDQLEWERNKSESYQVFLDNLFYCMVCTQKLKPEIIMCPKCQANFCSVCILAPYLECSGGSNVDDDDRHHHTSQLPTLTPVQDTIVIDGAGNAGTPSNISCPACRAQLGPVFHRNLHMERTVESFCLLKRNEKQQRCSDSARRPVQCTAVHVDTTVPPSPSVARTTTEQSAPKFLDFAPQHNSGRLVADSFSSSSSEDEDERQEAHLTKKTLVAAHKHHRSSFVPSSPNRIVHCNAKHLGCSWKGRKRKLYEHQETTCRYKNVLSYMRRIRQTEAIMQEQQQRVRQSIPVVQRLIHRFTAVYNTMHRYANCQDFVLQLVQQSAMGDKCVRLQHVQEDDLRRRTPSHCSTFGKTSKEQRDTSGIDLRLYQYPVRAELVPVKKQASESHDRAASPWHDLVLRMDRNNYQFSKNEIVRIHAFTYTMTSKQANGGGGGGSEFGDGCGALENTALQQACENKPTEQKRGVHPLSSSIEARVDLHIGKYQDPGICEFDIVFSREQDSFVLRNFVNATTLGGMGGDSDDVYLYFMFFVPTRRMRNTAASNASVVIPPQLQAHNTTASTVKECARVPTNILTAALGGSNDSTRTQQQPEVIGSDDPLSSSPPFDYCTTSSLLSSPLRSSGSAATDHPQNDGESDESPRKRWRQMTAGDDHDDVEPPQKRMHAPSPTHHQQLSTCRAKIV